MADSFIPVTPGIGINLQSYQNTVNSILVQSEAVTLTDSSGAETGIVANPLTVRGLIAVANAANPTDTEGASVPVSVDLAGNLRSLQYFSDLNKVQPAAPAAAILNPFGSGSNLAFPILASHTTFGTSVTLPFLLDAIGGLSNDSLPIWSPLPLGPSGKSVITAIANAANPTIMEAAGTPLSTDLGGNLRSLQYFSDLGNSNPAAPAAAVISNGGSGPNFSFQILASYALPGTAAGPSLPFFLDAIGGLTNDTPQTWQILPLGTLGRSVIVEGVAGGTPIPISGTITATVTGPIAVTQSTSPWIVAGGGTAGAPGTAVLTIQGISGGQVVPISGAVTIAANSSINLNQVAGTALGATAVTNFGTAPAAAAVPGVNASLFAGTTGITATGSSINANITNTVPVSGTIAVTQSTSPWVTSFSAPQHVIVDSGPSSGVQFADDAASGGTPTGTLAMGWDSANSVIRALKVDPAQGLIASNGASAQATAAWTSGTAVNTTVVVNCLNYSSVVVALNQGTTIAGGVVTFEVSDTAAGTNWYTIFATRTNSTTIAGTYSLVASTNQGFIANISGWAQFRVRLSTVITGTATVNVGVQAQAASPTFYGGLTVLASGSSTIGKVDILGNAGATLDSAAGTPNSQAITIQGNSSGVAVPVSLTSTTITGTIAATQSGAWNINQTLGSPGFEAITDGTNGPAAVKAASTAAVATDKALVVAISPNNTLPISGTITANQGTAAASTAGWPVAGANVAETTAAWTSATSANTVITLTTKGYNSCYLSYVATTTITGGAITFEMADDAGVFITILDTSSQSALANLSSGVYTLQAIASPGVAFYIPTHGASQIRVRLSTVISGTGTVTLGLQASTTPSNNVNLMVRQSGSNSNYLSLVAGSSNNGLLVNINGSGAATLDAVNTAATAPANGLLTLVKNVTTAPSLTTGQSVAAQCDYVGSQYVKPYRRSQTVGQGTTIASTSAAMTIMAAQAAGIFADISSLVITVTPAATTDLAFTATLSDGTSTYIYDMDTGALATATADPTIINLTFNPPLPATSAATAWTLQLSVATVTVHVTAIAVLQKAS